MPTPYAYLRRQVVPLAEAKIGIMTHAFNYGTGVFEGIRGNWNADDETIYLFRVREHFERLSASCKILHIDIGHTVDEMIDIVTRLVGMSGYREDVYIRPLAYKASEVVGVRLHDLEDDLLVFVTPFGAYLDTEKGIRCQTSSWRRVDDVSIPARAKVTGIYVNSALAKTEAQENGFDEAIMLNQDGHVSEGSGENILILRHGRLITPARHDNILEGITLATVEELAREELGLQVIERTIDRSELYIADEVLMTGTAAHVSAVIEIDRRPIGDGQPGKVTRQLQKLYFDAITGRLPKYERWCTPVSMRETSPLAPLR
ncbi:MAG TPA: branched-chain amino acid transaminase [Dehalococcoidia bacterium]|nr:branched-chain amino acid transaminase [Dehalococcoidia bacterium]